MAFPPNQASEGLLASIANHPAGGRTRHHHYVYDDDHSADVIVFAEPQSVPGGEPILRLVYVDGQLCTDDTEHYYDERRRRLGG